jgi:hypothetical protein
LFHTQQEIAGFVGANDVCEDIRSTVFSPWEQILYCALKAGLQNRQREQQIPKLNAIQYDVRFQPEMMEVIVLRWEGRQGSGKVERREEREKKQEVI